jgi:hypothetical protein
MARQALEYWDGRFPWGCRDVLDRLTDSASLEDRVAGAEIEKLKGAAFEWMERSSPVDWTSAGVKAELRRELARQQPWCDGNVFDRLWAWLSWLGWHDGY